MGKIVFYYTLLSPPSRAVLLTGNALGLEFELINVDLIKGEQLTEEFKKVTSLLIELSWRTLTDCDIEISELQLNPQHTIPLIIDNGTIIYDSHAICAYLCDKYGNTDQLYPKDLVKRAEVDARLHFDTGFLFARLRFLFEPILYYGATELPEDKVQYVEKCWPIMEAFLERGPYLCGNELTIADYCCVATVSSVGHYGGDLDKYPKLTGWLRRMKDLPDYERLCGKGGDLLVETVGQILAKNRLKWRLCIFWNKSEALTSINGIFLVFFFKSVFPLE